MRLDELCEPFTSTSLELAIDLSCVCRDKNLDSLGDIARWDRLIRVLETWNSTFEGFEKPKVKMVADKNLRFKFSKSDKTLFERALKDNYIVEAEKADPVLLDLVEKFNCLVLSNDNYVAYHRERPWLTSSDRKRFIQWRMNESKIELELLSLRERTGFSQSRAEEKDQLKNFHIDPDKDSSSVFLQSLFRCENSTCIRRQLLPEGALSFPERGDSDTAVCPSCRVALTLVGDAKRIVVLKITGIKSGKSLRIPLEANRELTIGRASSGVSLSEILDEKDNARISRSHLKVGFNGDYLYIVDLNSSNGSMISTWDSSQRKLSVQSKVEPGKNIKLKPRDLVVLSGVLEIQRSGRRFPFDLVQHVPGMTNVKERAQTIISKRE